MQVRNKVNPRRVVNLLQEMAKKITEEGEQEAALYKKFRGAIAEPPARN